jgi:hypothetical protein
MQLAELAPRLAELRGLAVRLRSVAADDDLACALADGDGGPRLVALAHGDPGALAAFEGERHESGLVGPPSARNAAALRERFAWLRPRLLGVHGSVGLGDRLGLATPGHIMALRTSGTGLAPVFAQQSIRELDRTGRSPRDVLDDATWGVFGEGWRHGYGADADHLKTAADVDRCAGLGYTMFTIDPGDHVKLGGDVPWDRLDDTPRDAVARYAGILSEDAILGAAAKYGAAIAHVAALFEHLRARAGEFELEISVDETETPTTHAEHVYLASELRRLGVDWVSLAPRFVGRFEKGVDFIGDVDAFTADFAGHAEIAERLGGYKLSLHSGSDKFSIYPAIAAVSRGRVHLKTSGTSYLEALRTVAAHDDALFRRLYALARERFAAERASYHVSVATERLPTPEHASLDDDDVRRVLHVTFGSVLGDGELAARIGELRDEYAANLERHLARHLRPFA